MRLGERILEGRQRVTAVLGPTNTGKTWRAIQAMLAHPSGMIGLPLRLLAREVYDRVVVEKGAHAVALITGEEKRIPPNPAYFVCTVEAMPLDRPVAFLAIDEIQLAGDRNRGHAFTDRLLNARGVLETMLLGSDTIEPLVRELVPGVRVDRAPRLSRLTWSGVGRLARVPRRSAVVAFSADQVYRHAEQLRALHGGVAVVMGALSPRTRNAQVALYESGEVGHLVATDAIGMGLNMDVRHVRFGAFRKYDGRRFRDLSLPEIAQIAGRAGRYRTDGSFGALPEAGALDAEQIEALEAHAFEPLTRLYWRNADLDYRSPDALLDSLRAPPPHPALLAVRDEDDERAFEDLAGRGDLPLSDPAAIALLWEVCRIPDYRKTLTGEHVALLHLIARQLLERGSVPSAFVGERLERLDRPEGDIETLMARIAHVRTWTYVSHQRGWLDDASGWQERTRSIEDRLSDALHEALRRRFVDARTLVARTRGDAVAAVAADGVVRLEGLAVGRMDGLDLRLDHADPVVERAVRRGLASAVALRAEALIGAEDDAFARDLEGRIWWEDGVVGQLVPGPGLLEPRIRVARLDLVDPVRRQRIRDRLAAWANGQVAALLAPLRDGPPLRGAAAGLCFAVGQGLGSVPVRAVRTQLGQLSGRDRRDLGDRGIRLGARHVYAEPLLAPDAVALRSALWSVHAGVPVRLVPGGAPPDFPRTSDAPSGWLAAIGYVPAGPLAIRVDVAEARARQGGPPSRHTW